MSDIDWVVVLKKCSRLHYVDLDYKDCLDVAIELEEAKQAQKILNNFEKDIHTLRATVVVAEKVNPEYKRAIQAIDELLRQLEIRKIKVKS